MRGALTIARKELNVAFTTPIAWVVFAMMAFVAAVFFSKGLYLYTQLEFQALKAGQPQLSAQMNLTEIVVAPSLLQFVILLFLASPLLTMGLFADEKGKRTFELLMTAPIRPLAIVVGKYLASLVLVSIPFLFALLYTFVLAYLGSGQGMRPLAWETVTTGFVGLFLVGAMCQAIGLFISSLTDSSAVAALVTGVALLLLLLLMEGVAAGTDGPLRDLAYALAARGHLRSFLEGRIELKDVLYFLTFIALGLYLTERTIEAHRWA